MILAGGEVQLDPVRELVIYPALEQLHQKYRDKGGVELIVQTTGHVLTEKILGEWLDLRVNVVSVSGMDAFHAGFEKESAREGRPGIVWTERSEYVFCLQSSMRPEILLRLNFGD